MSAIRRPESSRIFERLIRGEATAAEYVAAVRAESRAAVKALRLPKRRTP